MGGGGGEGPGALWWNWELCGFVVKAITDESLFQKICIIFAVVII